MYRRGGRAVGGRSVEEVQYFPRAPSTFLDRSAY